MIEINLLPVREERRRANVRQFGTFVAATLVGTIVLSGAYHAKVKGDVSRARKAVQNTQRQIDQLKPQLDQVEQYRAAKERIEGKLDVIRRLNHSRSGPVHVMDELATHSPERLWLTRFEIRKGTISIEGMSLDNELVALFLTALSESPYFQDVELQQTEATNAGGLRLNQFRLTASITNPEEEELTTAAVHGSWPTGTGR